MVDAVIPKYNAIRTAVPNTYDPNRRAGSGGQRYFTETKYVVPGGVTDAENESVARGGVLSALNASNPARQARTNTKGMSDAEINDYFTQMFARPELNTERKQIDQAVGGMNQHNLSPQRVSEATKVPLADIKRMMSPSYVAYGEAPAAGTGGAAGIKSILDALIEQSKLRPYGTGASTNTQTTGSTPVGGWVNLAGQTPLASTGATVSNTPTSDLSYVDFSSLFNAARGYARGGGISSIPHNGYYLGGATDGMADKIPASINGAEEAALSDGEFVIPADVVSHLGNGNSGAGAQHLYDMMDRLRKARTGTPKQGRQIDPNKFLPGGNR